MSSRAYYCRYNIALYLLLNSVDIITKKNLYIVYRLSRSSTAINNLR